MSNTECTVMMICNREKLGLLDSPYLPSFPLSPPTTVACGPCGVLSSVRMRLCAAVTAFRCPTQASDLNVSVSCTHDYEKA